jgi:tetratricopeptide (TPR) repeat protein
MRIPTSKTMSWFPTFVCLFFLAASSSCSWAQKEQPKAWPYDPDYQPITKSEITRLIRDPETTVAGHEAIANRAGLYHLLNFAVDEYLKEHLKRPKDAVLQSAFGYTFFLAETAPSENPSFQKTHTLHNSYWATQALWRGTKLAPKSPFCWRALAYAGISKASTLNEDYTSASESELPSIKQSLKFLEKAVELAPNDARTYRMLAWGYQFRTKFYSPQKELQFAQRAVKFAPHSSKSLNALAWAYFDNKDYKALHQTLQKAYALRPPQFRDPKLLDFAKRFAMKSP